MLHHVYAKTRKGHDEIVRPTFGLNSRQRRILIFADGIRPLSALNDHFPAQEIEDIISVLSGHHFIFLSGEIYKVGRSYREHGNIQVSKEFGCFGSSGPAGDSRKPVLTRSIEEIARAKEFMLEVAVIHLGILGRDIIQKIEAADSAQSLACLAGQWTMALCASKSATRYAQLYLEQLKLILFEEHEPASASPRHDMSSWSHMTAL